MYKDNLPYRALAIAILHQAIGDYVESSKKMESALRSGNPRRIGEAERSLHEIEIFFKSRWCSTLCAFGFIDGREILAKLKKKEWDYDEKFGYVLRTRHTKE